jgi:succinate dehydrogenase/fumarate reductase flavoprotein subunit
MRWDRHTLMAFGGVAAVVISGAMLLGDASAVFVPVLGMVAGIAAMAHASHERLMQRMETLERRFAQAEWRGEINRAG